MFNTKIISLLTILLFLSIGCKEATKVEDAENIANQNTLNDSDLGNETGYIKDYFYNLDEGIEAQFLYYNSYITRSVNTISNPSLLDPSLDTLNLRTFPYYTVEIDGIPDTISYMLSLTSDNIDNYSTLYPLDETNTSTNNWCNEMLVEYEGNCPDKVEVSFDSQIALSSVAGTVPDIDTSQAVFPDILSTKEVTFAGDWTDIDSLVWVSSNNRYDVITGSTQVYSFTLIDETDFFDSLIYVGIIDTNRYTVDSLMFIDRTEWERYDLTYKSADKPIRLDTTFIYEQIKVPEDSPMYRINGDCNQNLMWDSAEIYYDFGPDMCPDSLETGADTFTDSNDNGKWDETEPLLIDWNGDGEWTKAFCEVVDTDSLGNSGYGEILDEEPCNCLGDWRGGNDVVSTLNNYNWVAGSTADPNGDNWRDCGWDGYCPGHPEDTNGNENGTESNGSWDTNEGFEENGHYNFDILTKTGEYFIDKGNGVIDGPEFCITGNDGECDGNDSYEDRNCNNTWDDQETFDKGNSIWDDDESFIDSDGDGVWYDGEGNWRDAEPLYELSDRLETFLIDYSDPLNPVPITNLDGLTSVTLFYGTIDDSVHITYDNFLYTDTITAVFSENFYDIDSIVTMYTNKIIEYPLPGISDNYQITKTKWYYEKDGIPGYGYDYQLYKIEDDGDITKMDNPFYFHYYGYNTTFWETEFVEEDIYIYTFNGLLRDGEYYYQDTTIVTSVADYYVQNLYEVSYDTSVVVPFRQKVYNDFGFGVAQCIVDSSFTFDPLECPMDTTLTNTFKITRTRTITMIGNGVEFGVRNTLWLGSAGPDKPLGIVKDQLEARWSEPYWKEYGSGWNIISRLELRSLHKTATELSRFLGLFQPTKHISLKKLVDEEIFDNDPYIINSSYGIHKLVSPNEN